MQPAALLDRTTQETTAWQVRDTGAPTLGASDLAPGWVIPCQVSDDADLWFAERTADVERAKALCRACPLRVACLDGALERGEPWGVWGGEVLVDGAVVARKRGRGRPRKSEAVA